MIEDLIQDRYKKNWIKLRRSYFKIVKYNWFKVTTNIKFVNYDDCLETYNKRMYEKHKEFIYHNKVIYDIGAQFGDYLIIWNKIYNNTVYGFEILKDNYQKSIENLKLNNYTNSEKEGIKLFNLGIGKSDYIYGNISNNMLMSNNSGEKYKTEQIQNLPINQNPDMIKIDVEGFEIEVLQSLKSIIDECKPDFIIEIHSHDLKNEVLRLLQNYELKYEDVVIDNNVEYVSILFMKITNN